MVGKWTDEELNILKELFPIKSAEEVAIMLNRSTKSIQVKASRLNLKSSKTWSEKELTFLRDNYSALGAGKTSVYLNRSIDSVKIKANRIGLITDSRNSLINEKFGRLTVLKQVDSDKDNRVWLCECECGNKKTATTYFLKSGITTSCGCARLENCYKNLPKNQKGKNHPSYNPNLTDEERIKRRYILGKESKRKWTRKVFEKNNYKCVICNSNGFLNAHHLDGWNWCKEKRFDINNGITLCKKCHREFHNIYGYGDNTKEQFEEYKKEFYKKEQKVFTNW